MTPVSSSTNLVARLIKLLGRREAGPSDKLKELFSSCDKNPMDSITKRVKDLGEIFYTKYVTPNMDHPGSHEPIARKRLQMGEILYWKNLETILVSEKAKNKPLSNLLEQVRHIFDILKKNLVKLQHTLIKVAISRFFTIFSRFFHYFFDILKNLVKSHQILI